MKRIATVTAVFLAFACSSSIDEARVVDAERARAEAIARNDPDAYSQLVSPDLMMVDRTGELVTKRDRMAAVDSGRARNARRVENDVDVRVYGDVALVIGRAVSQETGTATHDFFTRIWHQRNGRLELVGAHYTDITQQVNDPDPETPSVPDQPIDPLPIATEAPPNAEEELRRAITDQHQAYWRKDTDRYLTYAGTDLLRIAENGIRTRGELVQGMRGNARLPAPPSDQLDVRVRVFGTTALATWLDQGHDLLGRPAHNRFTVIFARRGAGWQMVHIQSTGVGPH
jgi:ketosteroid isomerase-like protein